MKRFIICVISVIVLMALPARTFASPQDNTSSPLVELDGLKNRIQENDPSVRDTFTELHAHFAAHPNDYEHARFLNIKSYFYILS